MSEFEMIVKSSIHDYNVQETDGWLPALDIAMGQGDALLVDNHIYEHHPVELDALCYKKHAILIPVLPGSAKHLDYAGRLLATLSDQRFSRDRCIFVVGGGSVMDAGGFVASIYMRGVDWVYFPTTLLSQADSCIGSKTSLNLGSRKNLIGTFWPPRSVVIDRKFLLTLPKLEILSGIGEMLHFFLVAGEAHIESMLDGLLDPCRSSAFPEIVDAARRTLEIKKLYVEIDERDRGERRKLNFGHSFGHAIEAMHPDVPHGLAVALGMADACIISQDLGYLEPEECKKMVAWIKAVYAGRWQMPEIDIPDLVKALAYDKKQQEPGKINLILTSGPGQMFETQVQADTLEAMLPGGLDSIWLLT